MNHCIDGYASILPPVKIFQHTPQHAYANRSLPGRPCPILPLCPTTCLSTPAAALARSVARTSRSTARRPAQADPHAPAERSPTRENLRLLLLKPPRCDSSASAGAHAVRRRSTSTAFRRQCPRPCRRLSVFVCGGRRREVGI